MPYVFRRQLQVSCTVTNGYLEIVFVTNEVILCEKNESELNALQQHFVP